MSIAPVRAQYSFEKMIGLAGVDIPRGMKQASDGYFYLYGQAASFNPTGGAQNYVAKIDHLGNIIWQRTFTEKSFADHIMDMIELPDRTLFFGGKAQEQLQEYNARVTIITPNGDLLLDTLYPLAKTSFGYIQSMVNNAEKGYIVSIGLGSADINSGLMFQKTSYSGKRLWYKYLPYPQEFRTKKIFKMKGKDEYLVFGEKKVLHLDSMGTMIGGEEWALKSPGDIYDIVQNEDGTFTSLVHGEEGVTGYFLQIHDTLGKFLRYSTQLIEHTVEHHFLALTPTQDGGYLAAGSDFYLIDSNEQIVWKKPTNFPETTLIVSIGQSSDKCFYGCATDYNQDEDIFIFKSNVDGVVSGVNDLSNQKLKAQVKPNPSGGVFTITGEFKQAHVSVSNLLGQEVLQSQNMLPGGKLDATALENGIYVLTVTDKHNTYVQKVNIIK